MKDVFTPPPSPFYVAEAKGTMVCDPCAVAGLSGSITFGVAWTTSHTGKVTGTLEVKSASGELAGLAGAGSFSAAAANVSDAYTLELTLPSQSQPGHVPSVSRRETASKPQALITAGEPDNLMRTRRLGPHGPEVSALGLGCMGISQSYGEPDPEGGLATLQKALDLGITFFDTADAYGWGANEELVGQALREHRDEVFIATKCGFVPERDGSPSKVDGSPEHIRAACEDSLRRLGVRTIDLYYLHRVDPRVPIEESVRAMAGLVEEGKVRYLGLSEVGPEKLRKAHAVHPITAVQSEYSLFTRDPEEGVLPVCRELGIGFVPFSPLGRGVLTGSVRSLEGMPRSDFRRGVPRFQPGNLEPNLEKVERLAQVAREKGCTTAQLTLAWLLAQGPHIVPIPGTKHPRYLEENVAAAELSLSPRDLARVEEAVPKGSISGDRYGPSSRALVDR